MCYVSLNHNINTHWACLTAAFCHMPKTVRVQHFGAPKPLEYNIFHLVILHIVKMTNVSPVTPEIPNIVCMCYFSLNHSRNTHRACLTAAVCPIPKTVRVQHFGGPKPLEYNIFHLVILHIEKRTNVSPVTPEIPK